MLRLIGYFLLVISILLWGVILIIPWLDFSKSKIVGITAALIIVSEVFFYSSIIILGKSIFDKIKNKFKFWKNKYKDDKNQEII
jgi:hypothetical protein